MIRFLNSSAIYNSPFLALCTVLTFEHSTLVMCCHSCGQLARYWLPTGESILDFCSLPKSKEGSMVWSETSGINPGGIGCFHWSLCSGSGTLRLFCTVIRSVYSLDWRKSADSWGSSLDLNCDCRLTAVESKKPLTFSSTRRCKDYFPLWWLEVVHVRSFPRCLACCCCLVADLCLTLLKPHGPARLLCPWNFPDKNTEVGSHFVLQGIFLTQESNPYLLHWQADSLLPSHQGSPPGTLCLLNTKWNGYSNCLAPLNCTLISDICSGSRLRISSVWTINVEFESEFFSWST